MSLQESLRFEQISPKSYEHPTDRAATAAIGSIPLLDKVIKRLVTARYERLVRHILHRKCRADIGQTGAAALDKVLLGRFRA